MKVASTWRAVRLEESEITRTLRQRHTLWLHGVVLGLLVLGAMWLAAWGLRAWGVPSLALRYALTLGVGYLVYLGLLRVWASALLPGRDDGVGPDLDPTDLLDSDLGDIALPRWPRGESPAMRTGGGGDYGGGGAQASFDESRGLIEGAGETLGQLGSAAADSDEGAVVVVPVLVVFALAMVLLLCTGSLVMLYFGSEALLAVAVELAFSVVAGRTALRVSREGWLSAAVRLTWKPLLGSLVFAVAAGALIDVWLPGAETLPQALQMLRAARGH